MAEIFSGLMRRVITRSRRAALVLSALALAVPALAACSPGTGAQNPNATQIKAVASTTQICDYVTQLASGGLLARHFLRGHLPGRPRARR